MISIYYIIIRNSKKRETLHFYTALINNPDPKDPALGCPEGNGTRFKAF
jgi:hypothetical protein